MILVLIIFILPVSIRICLFTCMLFMLNYLADNLLQEAQQRFSQYPTERLRTHSGILMLIPWGA